MFSNDGKMCKAIISDQLLQLAVSKTKPCFRQCKGTASMNGAYQCCSFVLQSQMMVLVT